MNALEYFKARLEATVSPMDVKKILAENPESICIIDVRNAPKEILKTKIQGAILIPQMVIEKQLDQLPKDTLLILYCWETWCSLAVKAAVPLLEQGFKVKELYGGIAAWNALNLPVEAISNGTGTCCSQSKCNC